MAIVVPEVAEAANGRSFWERNSETREMLIKQNARKSGRAVEKELLVFIEVFWQGSVFGQLYSSR